MAGYIEYKVNFTDGQKKKLAKAFQDKYPQTFRLKYEQLQGNFPILLTQRQIKAVQKAKTNKTGIQIKISREQMRSQSQSGGFLGALAGLLGRTVLPVAARIAPKILAPLGVGALSGLASTGVSKILGNGMIQIAKNKRRDIHPFLTPVQQRDMMKTSRIKLTQKQRQDGGFLGMLAASLGVPLIASLLSGKGLQVDAQRVPYRRIPQVKKK
tara:strand:- start:362 stop:997 length:636 start_codon:yes stop_codon:yes gene_type:complete